MNEWLFIPLLAQKINKNIKYAISTIIKWNGSLSVSFTLLKWFRLYFLSILIHGAVLYHSPFIVHFKAAFTPLYVALRYRKYYTDFLILQAFSKTI